MSLPTTLAINAWTGTSVPTGDLQRGWALRGEVEVGYQDTLAPPLPADLSDWRSDRVGWGLVLPDTPGISPERLKSGDDAPVPIRDLLRARAPAPVLRYSPGSAQRFTHLRNYATGKDIAISGSPRGLAPDAIPQYLLLYGTPEELPWHLQYVLNATCCVGRLDLQGEALERYISALLRNWEDASANVHQAVVWAVDHGPSDITHLMRNAIAAKLHSALNADDDINSCFLDGDNAESHGTATHQRLRDALADKNPGLVVTTSHGQTGPLDNVAAMRRDLGLMVDQNYQTMQPEELLAQWQPDGAIWYAHACCSAGSAKKSAFHDIVNPGSEIQKVLASVASLGSHVAPLPKALLGATKPLRAFIGHVEPTFDWTIRHPRSGQHLTANLVSSLYNNLFQPDPVGIALQPFYSPLASLYVEWEGERQTFGEGGSLESALYCQLTARDLQSMVVLGDPTATLPNL